MADAPHSRSHSPADVVSTASPTRPTSIQEKIRCVFDNLGDEGVVQFWAPVKTIGGRWLLTTVDQPFALSEEHDGGEQYRLCSERYQYNLDMDNSEYKYDKNRFVVEEDPTIINGAPSRAFLNRLPVLLPDLSAHRTTPLESSALQCGMLRSVVLPVFDPSENGCVGVVECNTVTCYQLATMLSDLIKDLESEGLKTFHAILPYETVCGLAHARDEIRKALEIIWPKVCLDLVQVWIKDEKHVAFSSSLEDSPTPTERMLGIKWLEHSSDCESYNNEYAYECFVDYSSICSYIPLKMGEGLIGKTLQNHKPRFIKKVSKVSDNQPLMMVGHYVDIDPLECSCFVICLRSTETGDFDYVFEFLWVEVPNYIMLLESLLLSLKRCLPNFKYASGGELGDELPIIDVDDSTQSKTKYFRIFKGHKSSSASKVVKERSTPLEAKCKTPPISLSQEGMVDAARNLDVSLSTLKRKRKDQSDTNEEDKGAFKDPSANNKEMYLDENNLTIKAEYADDMIKFHLPISSATFAAIEKEVGEGLKLNPANYKIKYLDEDGDWILMTSDKDLRVCIKDLRNVNNIVRMRLLPGQLSDPSHTYQVT